MAEGWYVLVNNVEHGPIPSETLKQLARNSMVSPNTPVKLGASGTWVPADHVKGLFASTTSRAVPLPLVPPTYAPRRSRRPHRRSASSRSSFSSCFG